MRGAADPPPSSIFGASTWVLFSCLFRFGHSEDEIRAGLACLIPNISTVPAYYFAHQIQSQACSSGGVSISASDAAELGEKLVAMLLRNSFPRCYTRSNDGVGRGPHSRRKPHILSRHIGRRL